AEIPNDNQKIRTEIEKQKIAFIGFVENLVDFNLENVKLEDLNTVARKIYLFYESAISESHLHKALWPITEMKSACAMLIE
ncbi:MAG: TetR/AcrR family transcriptional regulator, partial [Pseudomonadota bacterium]